MTAVIERPTELSSAPPVESPRWVRPSVAALLLGTAVLYLWDLGASGWANSFYSAAVQAGAHSWKAMLFGSSDSSNFITVDKPPAALWVMDLSARVFGVNSWSILVPQALEGVASVGVLYLAVRRVAGPAAGLIAGFVLATTPVAALMFRFNNPDALLVLCLTGATYATVRSLETASVRWLSLAGTLIGLGFLSKALQAFLIVPVIALVYLAMAPTGVGRRLRHVLVAGATMLVAGGWWVALVELWPAGSRPYIGGSQDNSFLGVMFGYNGFGRLTGNETGSVGGGGGTTSRWGTTGLLRMLNSEFGGQASWLLPLALVLLAGGLWLTWQHTAVRASLLLWGGWLVGTGLVLSFAKGIIHPYYTVVLAPALGGVIGIAAVELWKLRSSLAARGVLSAALVVSGVWTYRLMERSAAWHSSLRPLLLFATLGAAAVVLWLPLVRKALLPGVVALALVGSLSAPALAAVDTAGAAHAGAIPSAAPSTGNGLGRPGGGPGGPGGGFGGGPGGGGRGGIGNLLDASTPSAELVAALQANASSYTWVAAAIGSNSAAGPQLASGEPVMAIGGFNGSDPTPTLAEFQRLVAAKQIHYFLGGGGMGGNSGTSAQITAWVTATFTATTIGGTTVYDLT
ncbi:MAG: glycosyl transferase family 39 [Frankiales bacterium]|nr:glycosyl transferase family 39 [Frankiales bacterium]